jgi:autotransporter-associated beta strand protein
MSGSTQPDPQTQIPMNLSTKSILSAAARRSALLLTAVFLPCLLARAAIVGPYTTDANTLYLFHFDEAAGGSVTTNVGTKGGNCITVTNDASYNGLSGNLPAFTNMLGKASYTGFGNCVSGTNTVDPSLQPTNVGLLGYDGNNDGYYTADSGSGTVDAIAQTNLNIGFVVGTSPFTLEALICPTAINANQEIICTDDLIGPRGIQFKITADGKLQFQMINNATVNLTVAIPPSGTNAFTANNWYHVAATYDGTNLKLYWTKMNSSVSAANVIGSTTWTCTTNTGNAVVPLNIGGENRGGNQESFRGLIDEVRISKVARGAGEMMFASPTVSIVEQPATQSIDYLQPVTFSVVASSIYPMRYNWRFNGTPISSTATNTSYSIAAVDLVNVGNYDVVVTNTAGYSNTSHVAQLIVGCDHFLAHRWSFHGDTTDSVGGATGTNQGAATVSGGALVLDGTTGTYMELPPYLLSGLTAVTFEFWVTYGTSSDNDRVFDFGNTNFVSPYVQPPQNYVYFSPHAGGNHVLGITGGSSQFQQSATGTGNLDGQTMHVACVVDPPNHVMTIYTNGVIEVANTNMTTILASVVDEKGWIGRSLFTADSYLNGSIDELRIYSGALAPASVLQSYSQGPEVPLNAGPVSILVQPTNTTVAQGATATFTVIAIGRQPITYQWYSNSIPVSGATNPALSLTVPLSANGAIVQVLATNTITGTNYSAASSNAVLTVRVPLNLTWAGVGGNNWNIATSLNWTTNSNVSQMVYTEADNVTFDNLGIAQSAVTLTTTLHPSLVTASATSSSTTYTLGGAGSIAGSASLTKSGASTLVIDTTNSYTGATTVSGGTLQIGNGTFTGKIGSGPVTNNAAIVVSPGTSGSVALTNSITGSGSLTVNGNSSGTVTLSASNSYAGGTTVLAGSLRPRNPAALGSGSTVVSAASAQLFVDVNVDLNPQPLTLNGSGITSDGALRKGGAGATSFGGTIALGSDTTLDVDGGATLNLTNASGINGASANANLTLAGSGAGNVTGPLSLGSGNITVGGGTWTVAPSNSYSGVTTINGGALFISGPLSFSRPPVSFNASQVTLNGGTLGAATNVTLNDGKIGITLTANSTITVNTNSTLTISNDVSGDATWTLTKTGAGTLVLNGANDFAGQFNVDGNSSTANDGTTVIANNAAIANILAVYGTPFIYIRNNNGGSSTLALDGTLGAITVLPDISLAGRNVTVPAIENIAGNNTISGNFTLSIGGTYILQSDSGTLTLTQPWPYAPPAGVTSSRNLTLTGAGIITMAGVIQDGSLNGTNAPVNVLKSGSGTLNLPVANTYSGTTIVSNGVLSLTGAIGTNTTTIAGGLLVGNGTITGPVTVASGGAIEAGTTNTIGTLHLSSTLALSGNTVVKINKSAGTHDLFSGQSSVTYGGTLTVTNLAGTLTTSDTFTLFSPGASASNFASILGSPGHGLAYNFANGVLSVVAVNTNSPKIQFGVSGNTLTLSWPTNLNWILQSQTNSLSVGLSSNWADVAGSASVTNMNVTINPTNPTVFYRMRLP